MCTWSCCLPVRALVMEADPNASLDRDVVVETYLRFASLCRKSRRLNLSERILTVTLAPFPNQPQVNDASSFIYVSFFSNTSL
mmetsp:Transcript_40304/g.67363  ORF Transcript_40304/g.67363 Transcript_40304/m.67363 type:complete len:83 (+) Transcript_40304:141-389(+)